MKMTLFFIGVLAFQSIFAEVPLPGQSSSFISIETLENSGQLEFKVGEKTEIFEFGKGKPHYAMGLVFSRKNLPSSFAKSIGQNQIVQIALGNRSTSAPDLITQFGSLTLKIEELPSSDVLKIAFQDTSKAEKDQGQSAFLILNSSQMTFSQEDQEKLKSTHFSETGEVTVTPSKTVEKVSLPNGTKKLSFKRKNLSLNIDAKLGTPFSGEKGSLKGTVQIPVFWPQGTEADAFVAELAESSLDKNPEISPPKEAPRTLASPEETLKPKRDK
jgi:hypothetical protein